jgi:hypothetical protein
MVMCVTEVKQRRFRLLFGWVTDNRAPLSVFLVK